MAKEEKELSFEEKLEKLPKNILNMKELSIIDSFILFF